jgi:lactate dehydrogenase-like 2-hydroxyacid dehydrogenase
MMNRITRQILKPTTRIDTIANLKTKVSHSGPYDALMIHDLDLIIDEEVLMPLLPGLKVVVSASAGYNEFDVNFMTANGIWFCNARHAVSEATADMAVFLILAVVRDTTRGEKQVRDGRWRGQITPTLDPNGLTLGIIGMGGIGKVRTPVCYTSPHSLKQKTANAPSVTRHQKVPTYPSDSDA